MVSDEVFVKKMVSDGDELVIGVLVKVIFVDLLETDCVYRDVGKVILGAYWKIETSFTNLTYRRGDGERRRSPRLPTGERDDPELDELLDEELELELELIRML